MYQSHEILCSCAQNVHRFFPNIPFLAHSIKIEPQQTLICRGSYLLNLVSTALKRRVQDLNLRAGISRFAGFRVRCITTLPTLHVVLNKYSIISFQNKYLFRIFHKKYPSALANGYPITSVHVRLDQKQRTNQEYPRMIVKIKCHSTVHPPLSLKSSENRQLRPIEKSRLTKTKMNDKTEPVDVSA